jgi:UDP-N-acetylglucosamine/UDP-N-acetyl-alpha-D-glucosaminouronate 4-epimerase
MGCSCRVRVVVLRVRDEDQYPLHQDETPRPQSSYEASKLAGEAFCQAWWRAFGVGAVALRYFNVYGPRQDPASEYAAVVPRFILACLQGEHPVIHGDGPQARDFAYVDDVVEGTIQAADAHGDVWGAALNVGGGADPTSVKDLLSMVGRLTGVSPQPVHEPARPGDVRTTHADLSRARALIGYHPRVGLEEGLTRTVDWMRCRPDQSP